MCIETRKGERRISEFCSELLVSVIMLSNHTDVCLPFFFFNKFIYLFIFDALGLHCCAQAFSSCGEQGLLFIVV